jgi:hypothetical protein
MSGELTYTWAWIAALYTLGGASSPCLLMVSKTSSTFLYAPQSRSADDTQDFFICREDKIMDETLGTKTRGQRLKPGRRFPRIKS